MRRWLVLVALAGVVIGMCWPRQPTAVPRLSAAVSYDSAALPVTVPLTRVGSRLWVDVSIGADGARHRMLLDTGAPTMVSSELASQHRLTTVGRVRIRSPDGMADWVPVVALPELRIGRLTVHGATAVMAGPGSSWPALQAVAGAGVIGADLMQAAAWRFDYQGARLTIEPAGARTASASGVASLDFEPAAGSSSPLLTLAVDGRDRAVLVDTGADAGLVLHSDLSADHPASPDHREIPGALETLGGQWSVHARTYPALVQLGDAPKKLLPVAATGSVDRDVGILGGRILQRYVVTVDWPARRITLEPG